MSLGEYLGSGSATTKLLLHLNGSSADSSGNNRNGTDTGITYSLVNGRFNLGAGFNGTTSKIKGSSNLGIDGGTITISLWVKFNSLITSSYCTLFAQQNSNTRIAYEINTEIKSGNAYLNFYRTRRGIAADGITNFQYTFTANKWTNLVLTYDNTSIKGYVDAKLVGTVACSGNGTGTIGNGYAISDFIDSYYGVRLNGCIDEIIVENRAWTTQEIQKYYTNALGWF